MPTGRYSAQNRLAQPGFGLAIVLLLIVLAGQIAIGMVLPATDLVIQHALHRPPLQLGRDPLGLAVINLISFAAAIALGLYLNRLPPRRAFPLRGITLRHLAGVVAIILAGGVLLSEADNCLRAIWPTPKWILDLFEDVFAPEGRLFSRIFLIVIVAPVTEELLFRGIILRGLLSRHRPAVAVVLAALLFALLHVNPWQFVSTFFLGAAFGWFYLRSGSVALCVIAHAIHNALFLVMASVPVDIPGFTGMPDYDHVDFQPWWLDLTGVALLLLGLWIMRKATPPAPAFDGCEPPVIVLASTALQSSSHPPPLPIPQGIRPPSDGV